LCPPKSVSFNLVVDVSKKISVLELQSLPAVDLICGYGVRDLSEVLESILKQHHDSRHTSPDAATLDLSGGQTPKEKIDLTATRPTKVVDYIRRLATQRALTDIQVEPTMAGLSRDMGSEPTAQNGRRLEMQLKFGSMLDEHEAHSSSKGTMIQQSGGLFPFNCPHGHPIAQKIANL
jgi:hypothetical protein